MSTDPLDAEKTAAALRWWLEAGVDLAIDDAPRDRFRDSAIALQRTAARAMPPAAAPTNSEREPALATKLVAAPASPDLAERSCRALAAAAQDLDALRAAMAAFDGCGLKATATQLVFADGVPGSRVMFVGEAPGGEEDRVGRPFVGRAGQLLDRMLASIGLDRSSVYIANVVPWRPPGNRTPTPQETQICMPFIRRQIELAAPEILVCLGASAMQTLLGVNEGITRARGVWREYVADDGRTVRTIAMLHPAYLLRQPSHKRLAWRDFRGLASALRAAQKP